MQRLYYLPSVQKIVHIRSWGDRVATSGERIVGLLAIIVFFATVQIVSRIFNEPANWVSTLALLTSFIIATMSALIAHYSIMRNNVLMRVRFALDYFKYDPDQLTILIPARKVARKKLPVERLTIKLIDVHPIATGITEVGVQGWDGRKVMASFPDATFAKDGTIIFGSRVILHIPRVILAKALSLSKHEINQYRQAPAQDSRVFMMRSEVASRFFELSEITFYPCNSILSPIKNITNIRIVQHPESWSAEGTWVSFPESDYCAVDGALTRGSWGTFYLPRYQLWHALEPEA